MKKTSGVLAFLGAFLLFTSSTAHAQLINYGTNIFQDTTSGLYWYQPGYFLGDTLEEVNAFLASPGNSNWRLATHDDLWGLFLNNYAWDGATGDPLSTYLGEPMYVDWIDGETYVNNWYGHYDDNYLNYAGLMELSDRLGGISSFIESIFPLGELNGAWVCSATAPSGAPVPEPASFILLGAGLFGLAGFRKRTKG